MSITTPHLLRNAAGLSLEVLSHGALRRIQAPGLMLNLFPGNELEGGPANLWLRRRDAADQPWRLAPLLGPQSPLHAHGDAQGFEMRGHWDGLALRLSLRLAQDQPTWFWHLELDNLSGRTLELSPVLVQDIGLAGYGTIRTNEFYVSHYLDLQPLPHPQHGVLLAARQNQAQGGKHPWLLAGSLRRAAHYATDGLQVWGLSERHGAAPQGLLDGLPSQRLQHEHSLAALQDDVITLAPGQRERAGFFLTLQAHHPEASSETDLQRLPALLALDAARPPAPAEPRAVPDVEATAEAASLFARAPMLPTLDLDAAQCRALFGPARHEETADGQLQSFFHGGQGPQDGGAHVVLRAKELRVQRPHGHMLRSGQHLVPDERALTSTCWMGGVFHSMVTQGHVSINRWLSTQRSWLGLFRSQGLRLFVQLPAVQLPAVQLPAQGAAGQDLTPGTESGDWQLLGLPSAFEMTPQGARWLYAHALNGGGLIEVCSRAGDAAEQMSLSLRVLQGAPLRVRASLHLALGGDGGDGAGDAPLPADWTRHGDSLRLAPPAGSELAQRFPDGAFWLDAMPGSPLDQVGDDALLYADGRSRGEPLLCLDFAPATELRLRLRGDLLPAQAAPLAGALPLPQWQAGSAPAALDQLRDILPWYQHNALVHYLSPRGLEQYSGGGWGTRDVCQGPLEMLLAVGRTAPVRDLLLRVFAAQNPDGDWPQWFMFFERERNIRAGDSHGDIVFWPLLGLAQYLIASGDASLLEETLPFHRADDEQAAGPAPTLWAHVQQALALIRARCVPGTGLAAYWHGDWNDSLQPADPALRERLCSSWTVTLHHQTLHTLARALHTLGRADEAAALEREAAGVQDQFQQLLVQDDVVAGYVNFPEQGGRELWIHPRDTLTGLHYSLLPMMHAVLDNMLSPEQARHQAALIEQHLKGPDGARLFDAPLPYRGGPSRLFQRAETSAFFGREIGVMYMHAHLRYAQMLAHLGQAEAFWQALGQAHPIALGERVPSASPRQANCYYSSSDAAFADRYQARDHYDQALTGQVALDGGWRVYSSGPGIAMGLVTGSLLGLRLEHGALLLDPVMPAALDGLRLSLALGDFTLEIHYRLGPQGHGVQRVDDESGQPLPFTRRDHPYRLGAAALPRPAAGSTLRVTVVTG